MTKRIVDAGNMNHLSMLWMQMHLGLQCVGFFREGPKGLEQEEEEEKDNDASHCANTFAPVSRFS